MRGYFFRRLFICSFMSANQPADKLVSLAEASEMYGFNRIYLAELAREGRLKAQKVGNMWVIIPTNVEDFIHGRKKRRVHRDDIDPRQVK